MQPLSVEFVNTYAQPQVLRSLSPDSLVQLLKTVQTVIAENCFAVLECTWSALSNLVQTCLPQQ